MPAPRDDAPPAAKPMPPGGSAPSGPRVFVVYGMPRTGTTYLYHALAQHPSIFVPYRKESHFFSVNYGKGFDWFRSLYEGMPPSSIGADINPMYFLDDAAADRLLAYDADVRVVVGVREPVDFAISLYGNMRAHGLKVPPIGTVVQGYDWPVVPDELLSFRLAGGFIERRLRELQERFAGRLMLYDFAAFDASPVPVLQGIERLLGLTPHFSVDNVDNVRINATGRRNPFGVNALIANQRVLDTLYAVLPRALIVRARRAFERLSARGHKPADAGSRPDPDGVTDAERAQLEQVFESDRRYVRDLFRDQPILFR